MDGPTPVDQTVPSEEALQDFIKVLMSSNAPTVPLLDPCDLAPLPAWDHGGPYAAALRTWAWTVSALGGSIPWERRWNVNHAKKRLSLFRER